MTRLASRLAALENRIGGKDDPLVIIFQIHGTAESDVIGLNTGQERLDRQPGETVADLVERGQASRPFDRAFIFFFDYSPEARKRAGSEELPSAWPDSKVQMGMPMEHN